MNYDKTAYRAYALDYPNCKDGKSPKRMFYGVSITSFGSGKWAYIVECSDYYDYSTGASEAEDYDDVRWFSGDVRLMQYTGLDTKDNHCIYEDDLVTVRGELYKVAFGFYDNKSPNVDDLDRGYGFYLERVKTDLVEIVTDCDVLAFREDLLPDIEIVGNIWENRELLTVKCYHRHITALGKKLSKKMGLCADCGTLVENTPHGWLPIAL